MQSQDKLSSIKNPIISDSLIEFLNTYQNFIIAGHKEPDGDCVGSSLALGSFLRRQNKNVILMSAGPFKRTEIQKYERLFLSRLPSDSFTPENTGVVIVDCAGFDRIGSIENQLKNFPYIVIDHHATNNQKNDSFLVMTEAPSTTFLIQSIIEKISGNLTEEEASALFFGLCTDTGFFRHLDERSSEVFLHASRLVAAGANPKKNFMDMNGGKSFDSRILIAKILNRMQKYYGGRLIVSYETYEDTNTYGIEGRDSDILYQLIQTIEGVEAICIIRQESLENCSVGFRSLDRIDVSKIAASFGGGGHKQASGLYIKGTIEELLPKFVEAFKPQML